MRTLSELRRRIAQNRQLDDRMDQRDYFGRLWVADYVANAAIVADSLAELLGDQHERGCCVLNPDRERSDEHPDDACCCLTKPAPAVASYATP